MNGRMSRLRRSLSRSVHQLNSVIPLNRSQTNLLELPPITTQSALSDKFASSQTIGQLRQLVAAHNEALREIINIFEEKVAMDFAYAKTMHKLSARLQRVAQGAECEIDRGWTSVAEQMSVHATLHSNLGSALNDDVVQPLRSIHTNQQKTIRTAEVLVDRETRKLKEKKEEVSKMKKSLYVASKELEKIEQLVDADSAMANKFSLRRKKLKDQVKKGEDEYLYATIDVEKQRRSTQSVLRKAVESLEAVERQRLAHCQTALGRVQRKMEQLGPNLQQMFDRYTNYLDSAVQCDASAYISSLQPATSAAQTVTLLDFFAENFSEIILGERRKCSLSRIAVLLDGELRSLYSKGMTSMGVPGNRDMSSVEFVEFLYYKVNEAINAADGGRNHGFHRLAAYLQKNKDKQGLPHSLLLIPLSDDVLSTPYAPISLDEPSDDYDKISDEGFYNSSGPRSTDDPVECNRVAALGTSPSTSASGTVTSASSTTATPNVYTDSKPRSSTLPSTATAPLESTIYPKIDKVDSVDENPRRTTTVIDDPHPAVTICRALYDFTGSDADEMSIRAGECVLVESRLGDDWLIGRAVEGAGRRGRFPTTYVTFAESAQ